MGKRICALFLVLAVGITAAFATVEVALNYSYLYSNNSTLSFDAESVVAYFGRNRLDRKVSSPLGVDGTISLFFGNPQGLELGIGMGASVDFFSNYKLEGISLDVDSTAFDFSAVLGPALRVTFAKRHSFYLSPGIQFNYRKIEAKRKDEKEITYTMLEKNWAANLNMGYRLWLFSTPSLRAGLDAGLNLGIPLNSFNTFTKETGEIEDFKAQYKIKSGSLMKFYVGFCFNLGSASEKK